MLKKAIIYLHGFNSASLDLNGELLINKEKLLLLQQFCLQKGIQFFTPNVDYRDFEGIVEDMLFQWNQFLDQSFDVIFMGSSMGGFASEYLAMKTGCKAVMINPAIIPTKLLPQFIGVAENYETGQSYQWQQDNCNQFIKYEQELKTVSQPIDRTILLDMGDELLDSEVTISEYKDKANIVTYSGGSHSFEHMNEALAVIDKLLLLG